MEMRTGNAILWSGNTESGRKEGLALGGTGSECG